MIKLYLAIALSALSLLAWADASGRGLFDDRGSTSSLRSSGGSRLYHK